MKSWNTIKKSIKEFARIHPMVNSFGTGNLLNPDSANITNFVVPAIDRIYYPLVFATLENANFNPGYVAINIGLIFMDKIEEFQKVADGPNSKDSVKFQQLQPDDVMSDMLQLSSDFVANYQMKFGNDFDLMANQNVTFFNDSFGDRVAGCRIQMTFNVPFGASLCSIPNDLIPSLIWFGGNESGIVNDISVGNSLTIYSGNEVELIFDGNAPENEFIWFAIPTTFSFNYWRRTLIDRGTIDDLFSSYGTQTHDGVIYDIFVSNWQTNAVDKMILY